ncbi:hypothetical protein ACFOVU_09015 [Nocardiopsis sediminis]|uniref:NERD domain-containing protein n=1 Tax=Nocardiopsis sediminis TaxID=1778267 RepID=A0ABV8FIU3_9ACTN
MRALIAAGAGVMATGFIDWRAGLLVAGLTALTYVLLATAVPRAPSVPRTPIAPRVPPAGGGGPERSLRELERRGYRLVRDGASRHLAIGPGGAYLLEALAHPYRLVGRAGGWRIDGRPAGHVSDRAGARAARLDRLLGVPGTDPGPPVVPVILVAGHLPEPVMRSGRAVIARPHGAVRYILDRPDVLGPADIDVLADTARTRLH